MYNVDVAERLRSWLQPFLCWFESSRLLQFDERGDRLTRGRTFGSSFYNAPVAQW